MKIKDICVINNGYVNCSSVFYSTQDILNKSEFRFTIGVNRLIGEIDSGNWAISYFLSMYKYRPKDFVLFEEPKVSINDEYVLLEEMSKYSCYMDISHPMFSKNESVIKLVSKGLRHSRLNYSCDDIMNIFKLDVQRFQQPIKATGNEIFRAMSAIAFAYDKQILCFPWMSRKRVDGYHNNLTWLLETLNDLEKIIILPIGT